MRNKIIFIIFSISILAYVFIFTLSDLYPAQEPNPNILKGEAREVVLPEKKVKTSLLACGDIMLSRHVGTKIRRVKDPLLPFRNLKDELFSADITFGNLESPFYNKGYPITAGMVFRAEPEAIQGLVDSGFDILSLANNHFGDQGGAGMEYTFDLLEKHNIKYTGAGKNITEAYRPTVLENNGIKFAFLGYGELNCSAYQATSTKAGLACLDIERMKEEVAQALLKADVVIISMHAGTEYTLKPTQRQKDFAQAAIDAGAKLVLGHHPHVVQKVEKYKHGFIIYSLGNFVFDQMWSEETREGVMARCEFEDKELKNIEFIPIIIEDYNQPRLANEKEAEKILKRMGLDKPLIGL